MKGRLIEIQKQENNNYFLFDRTNLKYGTYKGTEILSGGMLTNDNLLIGLYQKPMSQQKKLVNIGFVNTKHTNYKYIPKLNFKGGSNKNNEKYKDNVKDINNEDNISFKTAVNMLSTYYKENYT